MKDFNDSGKYLESSCHTKLVISGDGEQQYTLQVISKDDAFDVTDLTLSLKDHIRRIVKYRGLPCNFLIHGPPLALTCEFSINDCLDFYGLEQKEEARDMLAKQIEVSAIQWVERNNLAEFEDKRMILKTVSSTKPGEWGLS